MPSCVHAFTPSCLHAFMRSCRHAFMPSYLHAFLLSFLRSFLPSFLPSFLHSFIHSFIHSFMQFIDSFICPMLHDTWAWKANGVINVNTLWSSNSRHEINGNSTILSLQRLPLRVCTHWMLQHFPLWGAGDKVPRRHLIG